MLVRRGDELGGATAGGGGARGSRGQSFFSFHESPSCVARPAEAQPRSSWRRTKAAERGLTRNVEPTAIQGAQTSARMDRQLRSRYEARSRSLAISSEVARK